MKCFPNLFFKAHNRIYDAIVERDPEKASREMYKDVVEVGGRLSEMAKNLDLMHFK